jgi:hypothetical protein
MHTTTLPHESTPHGAESAPNRAGSAPGGALSSLRPLVIDVGIPVGSYYLLRDAFGLSLWLSLALSSIGPAVRSVAGLFTRREANLLALLMLGVNLAGIVVSFASGDPRAMIAKDSLVSSVIAIAILASVAGRRPLMSAGLRPCVTKGRADKEAAWDRLTASCTRFRRLEQVYSVIWGVVLLADCAARVIGAYTLPVSTMVWLGTVFTLGSIGLAMVASGAAAAAPLTKMIDTAARAR